MARESTKPYPEVESQPDFPSLEERVLAFWGREGLFRESVEGRPAGDKGGNEFVFYDGPPFANGLPHYGHLLTGYVKDVVPRYRTMRGQRVERRFGWDCHGLPAEMAAEKELGVSGRRNIIEFGIQRFNEHCRSTVDRYAREWGRFVDRMARWVDLENDYKTMELPYMESVMWGFKRLWDKGLIYESYRVMPYSWAAETPLSNFETRLDDSYRPRQDPAITVLFELKPAAGDPGPMKVMVWTTTPWTLPSNLALAVGPDIEYAIYEEDGVYFVLGAATAAKYEKELAGARRFGTVKGSELIGREYEPLFPFFADRPNAFRVLGADFVDTEEGTGVVHTAPGFGEDDQVVCKENGIDIVCPVDERGRFTSDVPDWEGVLVFDANKPIIQVLKERGVLVRHDTYEHNYPHCWRTDEPLIYRAISSYYVQVTAFRERLLELNQSISWYPEHIRDGQFGRWLEGARDWSISRNRFWGSPIPVWKSDDAAFPRIDVYGSLDELERDFGVRPTDLHRPYVDELTRPNPDDPTGKSTMRRVEDVLDGWFESGSMPWAQVHYPFENKEWFENHFPADFITEYVAQTRGWFYTMHVLSTALFDRHPFEHCICHGVVLDPTGRKISKRLGNAPDLEHVFSTYGSDALRWFFMSSPLMRGLNVHLDKEAKGVGEIVRLVLKPIWNAYAFFCLYANADGLRAELRTDQRGVLDRYILAKTREMVLAVQGGLESYDISAACAAVRTYLDALNNWYIRRSRPRFWRSEKDADKSDAYDTLYTVLHVLTRAVAPLLPFVTEEIYRGLTGDRSVHVADWPEADSLPDDSELVADMDRVRYVCSAALALREEKRLRVRLPLASLTIAGAGSARLEPFLDLIADEVNVKDVRVSAELEELGAFELRVNARAAGPRLGGRIKDVLRHVKEDGTWKSLDGGRIEVGGEVLEPEEYALSLRPREGLAGLAVQALPGNDAVVALDVRPGPELEREGLARDVVRLVQIARKEAALH
ncbi:MAG: isoleucine--tRNA ligase, partial [Planctomycetota bacterium]|nr:isoleucine--tRNA ligase [Planctomycetota bacterium]